MKVFKFLRYSIETIVIIFFFSIFKILGLKNSSIISGKIFKIVGHFFRPKKTVENNLRIAFPNLSDNEIKKYILEMWEYYGKIFAEYIFLSELRNNKKANIKISGIHILEKLKINNDSVVFISGHFDNFELMAMYLEKSGIKLSAIYRPLNNFFMNTIMEKLRIRDLTRRRDFLKKAVEEGQDATLELAVAEEELAEATKEADEPTRELIEAEQELLDIQTRIKELPDEIAEARSREEEAILRVVNAQQQLNDLNDTLPDLTAGQISFFSSIAISAGVAESKIDSLLSKYSLFDSVVSTPPVITPPVVKTDGGGVINTDVPMFAKGGFLPVGGQGIVGERGAELITATSSGVKISPLESGGLGETNITVNVTGFPTDPIVARNIADNIRKELVKLEEEGRGGLLSR